MTQTSTYKNYTSTAANSKKVVSSVPVTLCRITINKTSAHALTVYDANTDTPAATDNIIATIKASIVEQTLEYNVCCLKGLVIDFPASYAGDITVTFY